ncbi:hypothetical protein C7S17_1446 [Burkholderia thailandensis]|nr:hypothetical protein [Burkholderia thailandensis]
MTARQQVYLFLTACYAVRQAPRPAVDRADRTPRDVGLAAVPTFLDWAI